jgi:hypothetical protein
MECPECKGWGIKWTGEFEGIKNKVIKCPRCAGSGKTKVIVMPDKWLSWLCYHTHKLLVHKNVKPRQVMTDVSKLKADKNGWYHVEIERKNAHTIFAVDGLVYRDSRDNMLQVWVRAWWIATMRSLISRNVVKVIF